VLATARSILRRIADSLRGPVAAAPISAARIDLLLRAVARNAQPPSLAMLEVILREMTTREVTAALDRLSLEERNTINTLLQQLQPHDPEPEPVERRPLRPPKPPAAESDRRSTEENLESLLLTGDSTLERGILDRIQANEFDSGTSAGLLQSIIDGSRDEENRKRALSLVRPDRFSRARTIRTLAEIAAWGIERGLELTGKTYRFRLYGTAEGEIGMTVLRGRVIHFNPLPLLRGEADGRRIVEAIILHELGHHRYNTGEGWDAVQQEAAEDDLHGLLNLVQDEHLERNLRSIDTEWGDSLKMLAAWAFQRTSREIEVATLLPLLGGRAFDVLVRAGIEPARDPKKIVISSGRLLRELERHGSSFSRFLRALRMGLGNRTGDPKVAKALALFGKGFREATPEQMLEIARELRSIFFDETAICDALGLHGATSADPGELAGRLPGITDDDLSAEIDSIRQRASGRTPKKGSGGKGINRTGTTEFSEIDQVVVLEVDREEYRKLAQGVAGWSRRLRRFLQTLGVSRITVRRRTAGSAVDRAALPRAIPRGDPRILVARRTVQRADLFLGVVIDCSGSMGQGGSMTRAHLFGALIAEAARGLSGIDARFFGFTDDVIYDAGTADHCAVAELEPEGGNNDAAALWYASRVAMASRRSARLLVMISDGSPTECSVASLRALVSRLTASGIACAQVAVQPIEEVCFPDYVLVDDEDLSDAVGRFGRIIVRLVRKVT